MSLDSSALANEVTQVESPVDASDALVEKRGGNFCKLWKSKSRYYKITLNLLMHAILCIGSSCTQFKSQI